MKIEVRNFEKIYMFELEPVTQICGQNISTKSYILESFRKYFSTFKYSEDKNKWRDNIRINGELVGRKYFDFLLIKGSTDILSMIKWTKQSMMAEYVKHMMQCFDWQNHLRIINDELEIMFRILNMDIAAMGNLEITYNENDVFDMIQKSNVTGIEQTPLEDLDDGEMLRIFLNLIERMQNAEPKKMIIAFENIDHIVTRDEYKYVIHRMEDISSRYDIHFIVTTSLDGYVECTKELYSGIVIFNSLGFQMPEYDRLKNYICEHYPSSKIIQDEDLRKLLEKVMHRIGKEQYLVSTEENVISKVINLTLMLNDRWEKEGSAPEIRFLKA